MKLYDHQRMALDRLNNGSILCGDTGSGKSLTALAYYFSKENGGSFEDEYIPMKDPPLDLYIITTARKRDTLEWEGELAPFLLSTNPELTPYHNKVVIDSWNNIGKYTDVENAFFIFDEQRVVGYGAWVKAFLKITKSNKWILLSATPGDTWMDYIPVFIANGFYKNKTEFVRRHVVYNRFTRYPKVDKYVDCGRLIKLRKMILVNMRFMKNTSHNKETVVVGYNKKLYSETSKTRWNIFKDQPMRNISEYCQVMRKISNTDESRIEAVKKLVREHPKSIIFYNFDYELDILRKLGKDLGIKTAELNGHKHEDIPKTDEWIYLVQYASGSEAWNCTETNTIIFYSLNYSWRTMHQSAGRIDRLNTPYSDLYYYYIRSNSPIDLSIEKTLKNKKNFNEKDFAGGIDFGEKTKSRL